MLEIFLLGRFEMRLDGDPVELTSRPLQKLLAYLALNSGRPLPRAKLSGILWLDSSESAARKNLRQNLWRLRQAIGQEYLLVTRDMVAFNGAAGYRLDVETLQTGDAAGDLDTLLEAVSAYRGELLPGFYDDWLQLERERLQAIFERRMQALLDRLAAEAVWKDLLTWAEFWIAHGQTPEPAYRALMTGSAALGDLAAVARNYSRCEKALQEGLGVEPSAETRALFKSLTQARKLDDSQTLESWPDDEVIKEPARLPAFLAAKISAPVLPVFVGRQSELARLDSLLEKTLAGQGQVAFLAGDIGSGKTSLMSAFAAQAGGIQPDLLVARGICNAFSGPGDPYLPFRKALNMLTGDLDEAWSSGIITTGQARMMWQQMPTVTEALLDYGPDLLDTIVPMTPLLRRFESAFPSGHSMLKRLKDHVVGGSQTGRLERAQLFEQVVAVLRRIAERNPVLVLLDDLHWVDTTSLDLLFHLSRSLSGARIFLVGAYRPEEVITGAEHPLGPLLAEFRRSFGDIWLDLNQTPGRSFVDQLVDSEANRLDEAFRARLFVKTKGHPLFTVELLRDMQERGNVIRDDASVWVQSASLAWDALPARVEGAIESRIGRLGRVLRDILAAASVEGETFTAQVVARLIEVPEQQLLRTLSQDLQNRHKLVLEEYSDQVGQQIINRFRFAHQMFQRYLYHGLSATERRALHGKVGQLLEPLYGQRANEIVIQLARHFDLAGEGEKAAKYLLAAGDQARSLYANQQAIEYYQQALTHLRDLGDDNRLARTWMRLGLTYHNSFDYRHSRQAYDQGFAAWKRVRLTPGEQRSVSTLRLCHMAPPTLDPGLGYHASSSRWIHQLFSGLVEESDDMVVVPDIAQRWQTRDGGRTYIFHLRQDAKWSDGRPVTAADFVLAWQRLLAPGRTDNNLAQLLFDIKGARAYNQGRSSAEEQLGISAPDDFTLAVELEQPASYFLQLLTTKWTRPVPRHLVAEAGDDWAKPERIVTNGPYTITKWSPETRITLARNPHYHGLYGGNVGQVEVSTIIPALEWDLALDHYVRGEVDILEIIHATGEAFSSARLKYGESYINLENPNTLAIAFNQLISPLDDIRVRRALAMAIDQEGFVRDLRQERAAPALGGWIPHALPGHSPDLNLAFDPFAARQLLAEAGYPEGRGFPRLEMVWPDIPANREQGDYLAAFWQEMLGVTIVPEYVDFFELMRSLDEGDRPPIFMSGWNADYSDPDNFMRNGLHKTGIIEANPRFRVLIDAARSVTDQATRLALYHEADKMLIEEALIVPLTYRFRHFLVHPRVRKLPVRLRWRDIIVDPD